MERTEIVNTETEKPSVKILIAYHKESQIIKNNILLPIQVGKALSPYVLDGIIGDDTGDNISFKNYNYAELTAIYYAWKNIESNIKGLMHYRRFLDLNKNSKHSDKDYYEIAINHNFDSTKFLKELNINSNRIIEILENNLIITRKKEDLRTWSKYTVREHYYATHIGEHLDMALDVIKNDFPEYYNNAIDLIDGYQSYFTNMIIMKSKDFDDYCNFLFHITKKIDSQINLYDSRLQQYSRYARYNGYLGERLTAIYINQKIKEGFNIAEFPAVILTDGSMRWYEYNTYDIPKYSNKKIYINNKEDARKPKVSVCIAAYNVEKFISQAIESVINQSLENIEILIINDGSNDATKDIIEKYMAIDNRIKVINKHNGGLGTVRNLSIEKAQGEYIHLMDGDDYMDPDFLLKMINNADKNKSDMVCSFFRVVDENNNFLHNSILPHTLYGANLNIFNTPDVMLLHVHVWDKIFLTKFLKDCNIYFPDRGAGEDIVFFYQILLKLKNISILRDNIYNYRVNNNSIQSKADAVLQGLKNLLIIKEQILQDNNNLIKEYFQLYIYLVIPHIIYRARKSFKDKKFRIEFYNLSKEVFKEKIQLSKNIENIKAYYNIDFNLIEKIYQVNNYRKFEKYLNNIICINNGKFNILYVKNSKNHFLIILFGIKLTIKKEVFLDNKFYKNKKDKIFSIYENNEYKRITIFGIKITIKRKYKK